MRHAHTPGSLPAPGVCRTLARFHRVTERAQRVRRSAWEPGRRTRLYKAMKVVFGVGEMAVRASLGVVVIRRPYITGPVAGATNLARDEKYARFARAELVLRNLGYEPINKLTVHACATQDCNGNSVNSDGSYKHSRACYLQHDMIAMLTEADSLAVLPQWQESQGAVLKRHVAEALDWPIIDLTENETVLGLPHELQVARAGGKPARHKRR